MQLNRCFSFQNINENLPELELEAIFVVRNRDKYGTAL